MPVVPSVYTEATLAAYMLAQLSSVAAFQGWSTSASFNEAVAEALLAYGQTDISLITGTTAIRTLRAHARYQAWKLVVDAIVGKTFHLRDGDSDLSLEQIYQQAVERQDMAAADLCEFTTTTHFGRASGTRGQ